MAEFGKDKVFNFTRQKLWTEGKKVFKGLTYPVYKYKIYENKILIRDSKKHEKEFSPKTLRAVRATELIETFGFTGFNLATYGGWTMQTAVRISGQFDRYVSLDWQSYIDKLFLKRSL